MKKMRFNTLPLPIIQSSIKPGGEKIGPGTTVFLFPNDSALLPDLRSIIEIVPIFPPKQLHIRHFSFLCPVIL
jgi:hypothetical protein